jgi:hypothetical protein
MSKQYLRILLALVGFVGMSAVARAEIRGEIVVTVPFDFVAGGKNLPAGTYTVSRFSDDKLDGLILSSYENHVSVIVYPTTVGDAAADKPSVSFNRVGEARLLSKIETAYDIYTIRVSPVDHATLPELR